MVYVADTHSFIWFLANDQRLSKRALEIFERSEEGEEIIIIPTIVLAEISFICDKKKVKLKFKDILIKIKESLNYVPYNLDLRVIERTQNFVKVSEMHDKIIVATAQMLSAKLITNDLNITNSGYVQTVW